MAYRVAAIDVHKMVLIVAVAKAADEVKDPAGEALEFECRRFGATAQKRTHLIAWLDLKLVSNIWRGMLAILAAPRMRNGIMDRSE
jgi:hypothetical protein